MEGPILYESLQFHYKIDPVIPIDIDQFRRLILGKGAYQGTPVDGWNTVYFEKTGGGVAILEWIFLTSDLFYQWTPASLHGNARIMIHGSTKGAVISQMIYR